MPTRSTAAGFAFVRAVVDAFHLDPVTALAFVHPDVELRLRLDRAKHWHGHASVLDGLAPIFAAFDGLAADVTDVFEFGSGLLVARVRHSARGGCSRALCRSELFHCVRLRDDLVVRWDVMLEEAPALAAAVAAACPDRSGRRAAAT